MTRRLVLILSLVVAGATGCTPREVLVEAHRGSGTSGAGSSIPENTLPAFRAGEEAGADVLEMDAHLSADGVLIVLHDDTLDRTTNATGCLAERSRDQLAEIDAAARTPLEGTGVRLPTVPAVLDATRRPIDLELKRESDPRCPRPPADAVARGLVDAIEQAKDRRRISVSSFDREVLDSVHRLAPDVKLAWLSTSAVSLDDAEKLGVRAVSLHQNAIDGALVAAAHARSIEVRAWTVDAPEQALRLANLGVDRIITDDPGGMRRALASRGRAPRGVLRAAVACAVVAIFSLISRRRARSRAS